PRRGLRTSWGPALALKGAKGSAELAGYGVEERYPHEEDQQRYPHLLSERLRPIRHGAALHPLDELEDDLAAVEDGDRQQVEESQGQRDQHQEAQERAHTRARRLTRVFGDRHRPVQILQRDLPEHH